MNKENCALKLVDEIILLKNYLKKLFWGANFLKISQISNFVEISQAGDKFFHARGWKADMTKRIVAQFCTSAKILIRRNYSGFKLLNAMY